METEITGARRSSYQIQESDFGKSLKLRIRFSDYAGNQESLTSAAVGPIIFPLRPPSNLKAVPGDGKVGISWDAPENERPNFKALDYEVRWRAADSTGEYSSSGELCALRYIITGLTNGEQIRVQVRARYSGALSSDASLSSLDFEGISLNPTFSASSYTYTASVGEVVSTVTIDAEATDSDATLSVSPSVDVDPSVDGQQVNLDAGENVIAFTVTAENGVGQSTYTVTVTRAESPPGAPRSAMLVTYDDEELTIDWKTPEFDGGAEIIGFKVQWMSGTQDWDSSRQYDLKGKSLNPNVFGVYSRRIASLTNGIEYTVRILAYNEHGDGVASDEITGTPTSLQAQLIDYIDEEVIGEYGDDHAWLSQAWNHMTSNNLVFDLISDWAIPASSMPVAGRI